MDATAKKIITAYLDQLLQEQKRPSSVFHFMKSLNMKEATFYNHFSSFEALEKSIWLETFHETRKRIEADKVYETYSAREKILAFYYAWIEVLKQYRSFAQFVFHHDGVLEICPSSLGLMRKEFSGYVSELIAEGKASGEIADRPFVTDRYGKWLWPQMLFILKYWIKDVSVGFEKTDAAIEKSVNFSFDLMANNSIDSFIDLSKFIIQR